MLRRSKISTAIYAVNRIADAWRRGGGSGKPPPCSCYNYDLPGNSRPVRQSSRVALALSSPNTARHRETDSRSFLWQSVMSDRMSGIGVSAPNLSIKVCRRYLPILPHPSHRTVTMSEGYVPGVSEPKGMSDGIGWLSDRTIIGRRLVYRALGLRRWSISCCS